MGAARLSVAAGFIQSEEARQLCVRNVYENLLGRSPEAQGLNAWTGVLGRGMTVEQLVVQVAGSSEFDHLLNGEMLPWEANASMAGPAPGPAGAITPFGGVMNGVSSSGSGPA